MNLKLFADSSDDDLTGKKRYRILFQWFELKAFLKAPLPLLFTLQIGCFSFEFHVELQLKFIISKLLLF